MIVHPCEVFQWAVLQAAASVIMADNHPSGEISLSQLSANISSQLPAWGDTSQLNVSLLDVIYEVEDLANGSAAQQYRRRHAARTLIPKFADEQERSP